MRAATRLAGGLRRARLAWNLYRRLIAVQIRAQLEYRVSFIMNLIATALAAAGGFATIALILQRFEGIGGWSLGEIAFLYGMMDAAFATTEILFAGFDPDKFAPMVQRGQLDQLLLHTIQVHGIGLQTIDDGLRLHVVADACDVNRCNCHNCLPDQSNQFVDKTVYHTDVSGGALIGALELHQLDRLFVEVDPADALFL